MRSLFSGSSLAKAASDNVILKIFNHKTKQVVTITNPSPKMIALHALVNSAHDKYEMITRNPSYCFDAFGYDRGQFLLAKWTEAQRNGQTLKQFINQYCTPSETNKITKWLRT